MPTVELRDIVSEDDVEAVMGLRRGPGQERYLGSMISHFEDAIADAAACPRSWSVHDADDGTLVGFVMISDGIPDETLAANDDIVGPYFLWRLLIDHRQQGRGYGRATIDAVAAYVRAQPRRPGPADELQGRRRVAPALLPATTASPGPARSCGAKTSSAWTSRRRVDAHDPRSPGRQARRRARAPGDREDRLADDRRPRRAAAGVPDLVPVGRRRDPPVQRPSGAAQRQPRGPPEGRLQPEHRCRWRAAS